MKKNLLFAIFLLLSAMVHAQANRKTEVKNASDKYANTELLPEGAVYKQGKITIKKGYRTKYADNKQVIIVQKMNGNITGAFTCSCREGSSGGCTVSASGSIIICIPVGCSFCEALLTIVNPAKGVAITKSGGNWKEVVLPIQN